MQQQRNISFRAMSIVEADSDSHVSNIAASTTLLSLYFGPAVLAIPLHLLSAALLFPLT